jgi:hypothetical protein
LARRHAGRQHCAYRDQRNDHPGFSIVTSQDQESLTTALARYGTRSSARASSPSCAAHTPCQKNAMHEGTTVALRPGMKRGDRSRCFATAAAQLLRRRDARAVSSLEGLRLRCRGSFPPPSQPGAGQRNHEAVVPCAGLREFRRGFNLITEGAQLVLIPPVAWRRQWPRSHPRQS